MIAGLWLRRRLEACGCEHVWLGICWWQVAWCDVHAAELQVF